MKRALILVPWRRAAFNYTDCFQLPAGCWAAWFQLHPHRKLQLNRTVTSFQLLCFDNTPTQHQVKKQLFSDNVQTACYHCSSHTLRLLSPSNVVRRRGVRLLMNLMDSGKSFIFQWEKKRRENYCEQKMEKGTRKPYAHSQWNRIFSGGVTLTCIHRMCHHSCPGTPHLDGGLLFPLLFKHRIEEISDFHRR